MKLVIPVLCILACTGAIGQTSTQMLMREKLESAHGILDALALEDFPKIEVYAKRLKDIGRATTWHAAGIKDFDQYAKSFQRSSEFLAEQAHDKNIEGVAIGYIRITFDCMQCHRVVRAKKRGAQP